MYSSGNIIYFTPFYFKNGNPPKPKYFIAIKTIECKAIIASLPTSIDHVPSFIPKNHGCINNDEISFNCYYFKQGKTITNNDWSFPRDTYLYGEQIDILELELLENIYPTKERDYKVIGKLTDNEHK